MRFQLKKKNTLLFTQKKKKNRESMHIFNIYRHFSRHDSVLIA